MPFTKHVGQIVSTQQKVVVMFRQLPDDPEFCLVVDIDALNQVYLSYSEVEAGSLPSPSTLDSFLDWPLLFNENLKNNPAYNDIITSVLNFDELITNNPECSSELE